MNDNTTSSALLEQLVYIDNFMTNTSTGELTPNLDMDGQLSIDLAAFADDSFIFPDEDKPKHHGDDFHDNDNDHHHNNNNNNNNNNNHRDEIKIKQDPQLDELNLDPPTVDETPSDFLNNLNVSHLPKFPVPPGAKSSLVSAGLSQNQIDLLSALIAQHQSSLGNTIPGASALNAVPHLPSQHNIEFFDSPVRQHNLLPSISQDSFHHHGSTSSTSSTATTSTFNLSPVEDHNTPSSVSSLSHPASEVDKRRRNTAASARFRIKKKLKEKQMENQLLSLNDLIKNFESKVQQLEMENKLLRNLIIEKGSQKSDNELKLLREKAKHA